MSTSERNKQDKLANEQFIEHKDVEESTQEAVDESAMIANALTGNKIKEMLSASGPTVKAVLLKANGTAEEVMYDTTPKHNHVATILKAPPSIIGQYPDLDVIVVGPRVQPTDDDESGGLPLNQHKLRYPFNNDTFYGDIFMYRFDQNCVMQDFPLQEYLEFAAKIAEDDGKVYQAPQLEEEEEEEEDHDDDVDEEEDEEEEEQDGYGVDAAFVREIIINKVKAEFPAKFGRDPTDEELESYIEGTMQVFAAKLGIDQSTLQQVQEEEEEEEEEEEDADYIPEQDPSSDDDADDTQLLQDRLDIEAEQAADLLPPTESLPMDPVQFQTELSEAMNMVRAMGIADRQHILELARQEYLEDTGEEPNPEMLAAAIGIFNNTEQKDVEEPRSCSPSAEPLDEELFAKEFEEALVVVRQLGKQHQKEFVQRISDTFVELNGVEPTESQLQSLFKRIKQQLADEAKEELLDDMVEELDEVHDEEYAPNEADLTQMEDDKKMEALEELMQNNEATETEMKKIKILVTPVKRRSSGSRMGVYLKEKNSEETMQLAKERFVKMYGREPSEEEEERLQGFLDTPMLFATEVDPVNLVMQKEDVVNDDEEEYDPTKDEFDYSADVEDEQVFEKLMEQQRSDENDDTSNMVDID